MSIYPTATGGAPFTRFQALKAAASPEDVVLLLNADARRFCPHAYDRTQDECDKTCGACIVGWLNEQV